MNNKQFKEARQSLGLTLSETAKILDVDSRTIRKWEASDNCSTARHPNPIASRVMQWMLDGFRPPEFPLIDLDVTKR